MRNQKHSSSNKKHILKLYNETVANKAHLSTPLRHKTRAHVSSSHLSIYLLVSLLSVLLLAVLALWRIDLIGQTFGSVANYTGAQKLSFLLIFESLYFASSVLSLFLRNIVFRQLHPLYELLVVSVIGVLFTSLALFYSNQLGLLLAVLVTHLSLLAISRLLFRSYSVSGLNFYMATGLGTIVGLVWGLNFFVNMPASFLTKALILSSTPFLLIALPSGLLHLFELYDVVTRDRWKKPRYPFPENWHHYEPFVSIHVPTYSEPPEIVIDTLDKLASVNYRNYEVILIDNNTKDENLWKPVEIHCKKLGSKFRFMHVEGITGAKAGALNYIHKYINPHAEIIAVIDADYQVDKMFIKSLIGYFQNPKVGFVQTPHDYREWQNNLFMTMCYWEYRLFFHTAMISLNERDAGITVGTMCLVRKEALEKAGGWSEWCVTEDSELAIRIHDVGYTSVYVGKTYGKGLIPDNFEDYKKQRYRWTAGPVQEFRHYYRHFIGITKAESKLSLTQRIFHLNHGLGNAVTALNIPMLIIGISVIASMIIHNEIINVPFELWITASITLFSAPLLTFLLYRVTIRAKLTDILAQTVATTALSHVIAISALKTALTGSAKWNRTNKFKSTQSYVYAFSSTKEEFIIGFSLLVFVVVSYLMFPYQGLSMMLMIGVSYVAISYFTSPLMAIIAVWSNRGGTSLPNKPNMVYPDKVNSHGSNKG